VLAFTTLVIAGGAVVRATGSGAGCGDSWPRCQGQLLPTSPGTETIIEFTHRAMSGAAAIGLIVLVVGAFAVYPRRHRVRTAVGGALVFYALEALIGASLVIFGWVDQDGSLGRVLVVPLHLMNTYVLLAWLAITAWWSTGFAGPIVTGRERLARRLAIGAGLLAVVGMFGAWNALADSLFPAASLSDGVAAELSSSAPFLLRVRVIHPLVAVLAGLAVAALAFPVADRASGWTRRLGFAMIGLVVLQFFIGVGNLFLLTPVETQVVHLLVADGMWVAFLLFTASALGDRVSEPALERAA